MLTRVYTTVLSVLFFALLAVATPLEVRQSGSSCSTGAIQCCNEVQSVSRRGYRPQRAPHSLLDFTRVSVELGDGFDPPGSPRDCPRGYHWAHRARLLAAHRRRCGQRQRVLGQRRVLREQQRREYLRCIAANRALTPLFRVASSRLAASPSPCRRTVVLTTIAASLCLR